MKSILLASFTALTLLGSIAPMARADISAFDLVNLARQGYLREQGIASHNQLATDYVTGRVTAQDIVEAAIANGRLDADAISDQRFLNAIEVQLNDLSNHN